jgi:hypothetical protein
MPQESTDGMVTKAFMKLKNKLLTQMKRPFKSIRIVGLIGMMIAFMLACQNDGLQNSIPTPANIKLSSQAALENNAMITATQDAMNVTSNAFASQGLAYGRVADEGNDEGDDDDCRPKITNTIKINNTNPDSVIISGMITVDFDADTTCHNRSGKIIDSVFMVLSKTNYQSYESISFQNYWKDSTNIEGSISVSASKGNPTVVTVNGSKIRYRDGSSSSWSGNLVYTYQKIVSGTTYTRTATLTGSWHGVTRKGTTFSANITKEVDFKGGCFGYIRRLIPVSGTVNITVNGVDSVIDYGDGTCDRTYTVTTAGVSTEHHLG